MRKIIIIGLVMVFLIFIGLVSYISQKKVSPTLPPVEKEIQTQLKELQTLQKKTKSLSEEQIQKQLEELNKLRAQQ